MLHTERRCSVFLLVTDIVITRTRGKRILHVPPVERQKCHRRQHVALEMARYDPLPIQIHEHERGLQIDWTRNVFENPLHEWRVRTWHLDKSHVDDLGLLFLISPLLNRAFAAEYVGLLQQLFGNRPG